MIKVYVSLRDSEKVIATISVNSYKKALEIVDSYLTHGFKVQVRKEKQ